MSPTDGQRRVQPLGQSACQQYGPYRRPAALGVCVARTDEEGLGSETSVFDVVLRCRTVSRLVSGRTTAGLQTDKSPAASNCLGVSDGSI
jgi:hypothetical protein